jgi:flagellar hook-associated protein FlgK
MTRLATLTVAVAAVLALAVQPAGAAQKPSHAQLQARVKTLTHSLNVWRQTANRSAQRVRDARAERDTQFARANSLQVQVATLNGQVTSLTGQVATLTTQRDQAPPGLSGQVSAFASSATSASDIYNMILAPSRAAWKCGGTTFLGSTFVSVDFNRIGFCD